MPPKRSAGSHTNLHREAVILSGARLGPAQFHRLGSRCGGQPRDLHLLFGLTSRNINLECRTPFIDSAARAEAHAPFHARILCISGSRTSSSKEIHSSMNMLLLKVPSVAAYDLRMLPRKSGMLILFAALTAVSAGSVCQAQQAEQAAPIRYHFGDDPDGKLGWANPIFDDSAWPVAKDGRWPMPPVDSDGFVWVRFHIPLRSGVSGPFAVRNARAIYSGTTVSLLADEVYVTGVLVGRQGGLPPNPMLSLQHQDAVFDIPAGQVTPGTTAVVAIRVWCPPGARVPIIMGDLRVSVDERRNLLLAYRADHASASTPISVPSLSV